jgi:hypothetical protein
LDADEEIRFQDNEYPKLFQDGMYLVECTGHEGPVPYRSTRKLFLHFRIITQPYAGEGIWSAFNVGYGSIRPGSKYFKAWVLANNDRMPSRNDRMSPVIFKGKRFFVQTRTVKPKRGDEQMGIDFWYSVIDYLKSRDPSDMTGD